MVIISEKTTENVACEFELTAFRLMYSIFGILQKDVLSAPQYLGVFRKRMSSSAASRSRCSFAMAVWTEKPA
jgi:hypothetical protein